MGTIVEITIPEKIDEVHDVETISFNTTDRTCTVSYIAENKLIKVSFPVGDVLSLATATQQQTVKTFIKRCIANGLNVAEALVPEDSLEEIV